MGNSAWGNDTTTTLVVPTGATTGARVVINGLTGQIQVYNSSNTLVAQIDSAGIETFASDGSAVLTSAGATEWVGPTTAHTVVPAFAQAISGSGLSQFRIVGPSEDASTYPDSQILFVASRDTLNGGSITLTSQLIRLATDASGPAVALGSAAQPTALQLTTRGQRAYAVTYPPTNYDCNANLTLSNSATSVAVSGCSASYTGLGLNAQWTVTGKADSSIGTVNVINVLELWVQSNGGGYVKQGQDVNHQTGVSTRNPAVGVWSGTGGNNNQNNTLDFQLRGRYIGGAGGVNLFNATHTTMQVTIEE